MKKIIAIMLAALSLLSLAACGAKEADYKLGMGVELSTASSKENNAQVDATVAAVILDANGKIVQCRIDVAQNKMDVTGGAVDTAKTFETKMELGSRYGMAGIVDNNGDGVMKEWNEQANAFEAYVVGKTAAEVKAIQTQEANGHLIAVDEALLKAGCSMQITDFITAVARLAKTSSPFPSRPARASSWALLPFPRLPSPPPLPLRVTALPSCTPSSALLLLALTARSWPL